MKKNSLKRFTLSISTAIISLSLLQGCQTTKEAVEKKFPLTVEEEALLILSDASEQVSAAAFRLAQAQSNASSASDYQLPDLAHLPSDLKTTLTASWYGPVTPFLRKLAKDIGWNFVAIAGTAMGGGKDAPIRIESDQRPIAWILTDIGSLIGAKGDVIVNIASKTITLSWKSEGDF